NNDPGPHALPWALLVGLVAVGGWELARGTRTEDASPPGERSFAKLTVVCIALIVYVAGVAWLGFAVSTFVFVAVTTWKLGAQFWSALLAASVILAIVWVLFVFAFQVQLPTGVFGLSF
ncbi:MAG TPA: tripartite tricarboxylate transporter TctB family protein, partial [Pirellulaceae bacterium]|nr:tripartite tricarboxylate transporter TctB family protein [Pirellulaceae bacterium]